MNRNALSEKLQTVNVRPDAYSLDGGHPSEAYVLARGGKGWRVYYSERGQESGTVEFIDESSACVHLLALIERDRSTRT